MTFRNFEHLITTNPANYFVHIFFKWRSSILVNKRKFKRITIDSRLDTDLFVDKKHYKNIVIKDLSLSGLFTLGEYEGKVSDEYELLLQPLDNNQKTFKKTPCKIARINQDVLHCNSYIQTPKALNFWKQ